LAKLHINRSVDCTDSQSGNRHAVGRDAYGRIEFADPNLYFHANLSGPDQLRDQVALGAILLEVDAHRAVGLTGRNRKLAAVVAGGPHRLSHLRRARSSLERAASRANKRQQNALSTSGGRAILVMPTGKSFGRNDLESRER